MGGASDVELVAALRRAERTAFDLFFARYFDRVHRFVSHRIADADAAQRTTEAALHAALADLDAYPDDASLDRWVLRHCRDALAARPEAPSPPLRATGAPA